LVLKHGLLFYGKHVGKFENQAEDSIWTYATGRCGRMVTHAYFGAL